MAPSTHPQAQFVPISPALDLGALVEGTQNFDYVTRLPNHILLEHSVQSLEQLVLLHVVIGGKPLVIEGWGDRLPGWLFSPSWLLQNLDKKGKFSPLATDIIADALSSRARTRHYQRSQHTHDHGPLPARYGSASQSVYVGEL